MGILKKLTNAIKPKAAASKPTRVLKAGVPLKATPSSKAVTFSAGAIARRHR